MRPSVTAEVAYAVCEGIAESCALASSRTDYGDGYRAAARQIAAAIRSAGRGDAPSQLERDLRDAEIEARTLARVVDTAARMVEAAGDESELAHALRSLVRRFFPDDDLPPTLRERERQSGARLSSGCAGAESPRLRAVSGGR